MRHHICLLLVLLLLPMAIGTAEETYPVPNPENMWELLGDGYDFEVIPMGEITAGTLEGEAYTIRYVGTDQEIADKFEEAPYVFIHLQYFKFMEELGITIEDLTVTVNGTEAELFTYPSGAQVLYAACLPGVEPLMIIQKDSGLSLAEAKQKGSDFTLILPTSAPTAEPTAAPTPTQRPQTGSTGLGGVTFDWRNSGLAQDAASSSGSGLGGVTFDWRNSGLAQDASSSSGSGLGAVTFDWRNSDLADPSYRTSDAYAGSGTPDGYCVVCHNTGVCDLCDGKGKTRVYWLSGWGTVKSTDPDNIRFQDCEMCDGTGKCPYCQ